MTINEALQFAYKKLNKKTSSPILDAEVLLSFVLSKPKEFLLINPDFLVKKNQENKFIKLLNLRATGYPIAYVTGFKEFFGLSFIVNSNVLIPRPDTEPMVEIVLKRIKGKKLNVLDVGTGSGCIAISLAKHSPTNNYLASDVSQTALSIAKKNAKLNKTKVKFIKSFLLNGIKQPIDVLVANLPYGWKGWKNNSSVDTMGLSFEPSIALFTNNKGLELIKKFLAQIQKQDVRLAFLEFDPRQVTVLKKMIRKQLPDHKTTYHKDMSGRIRFVELSKSNYEG